MRWPRGVRARLVPARWSRSWRSRRSCSVIGASVFVEARLRDQALRDAAAQARFDLTVTVPEPAAARPADGRGHHPERADRHVPPARGRDRHRPRRRRDRQVERCARRPARTAPAGRARSRRPGRARLRLDGRRRRAVARGRWSGAGRRARPSTSSATSRPSRPRSTSSARVLLVGRAASRSLALLTARVVARGILAPIEEAGRTAERIERGDLLARVPVTSHDEFGIWADRFNRMTDTLAESIRRLEAAQHQNRRFVADVSHELRTPLTALVAEASIVREHLDEMPPETRRAAELLVNDVAPDAEPRRGADGAVALRRRRRGGRGSSGSTSGGSSRRCVPRALAEGPLQPARQAGHRRGRPTPPRADPRQLPRQRPRARRRRQGRRDRARRPARRGRDRRVGPGPGRAGRPPRADLRPLHQGRSVAFGRQQRAGAGDRRGARGADGRLPAGHRTARVAASGSSWSCRRTSPDRYVRDMRLRRERGEAAAH